MKSFNYLRAWREAAAPLFAELPPAILELYHETRARARNYHQDSATRMVWPKFPDLEDVRRSMSSHGPAVAGLRASFEAADHDALALAAAVIHDYGHWHSSKVPADLDEFGTHWKFSNYANQVLSKNLGLRDPYEHDNGNGFSLRVLEGQLRGCVNWHNGWTWAELGIATRANLERFRELEGSRPAPPSLTQRRAGTTWDTWANDCARWLEGVRAELVPNDGTPLAKLLRAGELFMEDQYQRCRTCGHVEVAKSGGGHFREELEG